MTRLPRNLHLPTFRVKYVVRFVIALLIATRAQADFPERVSEPDAGLALQNIKTSVLIATVQADEDADLEVVDREPLRSQDHQSSMTRVKRRIENLVSSAFSLDDPNNAHDQPGAANDLRWLHASRLLEEGRPFTAARELYRLARILKSHDTPPPSDWSALLARCLLKYGTPEPAKKLLHALPAATRQDSNRDHAWIDLADYQFHHGEPDAALASLDSLPAELEGEIQHRAYLLRSLILMSLNQDRRAVDFLAKIQPDPKRLLSAPADEVNEALIPQYNLGVALLRTGQVKQGRSVLNRVGNLKAKDHGLLSVSEKANLVLGWQFLRESQGATARPIFERVSLEGPFSSRALLGLGWAALTIQGDIQSRPDIPVAPVSTRDTPTSVLKAMQRRKFISCEEFNRLAQAPQELCTRGSVFERDGERDGLAKRATAALSPWIELQSRDAGDAAVREAWTALPHAFAQLGATSESRRFYLSAITKLEAEQTSIDLAIKKLRHSDIVIPERFADYLTHEPTASISAESALAFSKINGLEHLSNQLNLAEALETLFAVIWLQQQTGGATLVPAETHVALEQLRASSELHVKTVAIQQLDAENVALNSYIKAARSGLADIYDPPSAIERKIR